MRAIAIIILCTSTCNAEVLGYRDIDDLTIDTAKLRFTCSENLLSFELIKGEKEVLSDGGAKIFDVKEVDELKCRSRNHDFNLKLHYQPASDGSGFCSAASQAWLQIKMDNIDIMRGKFIDYCTQWGVSSFRYDSSLRFCGKFEMENDEYGRVAFGCIDYGNEDEFLKKNIIVFETPYNTIQRKK